MLDIRLIRDDPAALAEGVSRRGMDGAGLVDEILEVDARWREAAASQENARAQVKALSKKVGEAKKARDDAAAAQASEESRRWGESEKALAAEADALDARRRDLLLRIPNIPAPGCPDGAGPEDNPVVRWWAPFPLGEDPRGEIEGHFAQHQRVPHWEIGAQHGILDLERGAKLSGAMFALYRGWGAMLVRALTQWALDTHAVATDDCGAFEEIRPPTVVRTDAMVASGNLPKFADEAYHLERDDLWAIPTAEVPLTSLSRDEILAESDLPVLMCAYTPCFRREAGSAGRDTRGVLRVHEFDKVEILAYTTPDQAVAIHDALTDRAEQMLRDLGLAYRVLDLCAGDLGEKAARTYDLEVYAPGCGMWLEVSSVSWFTDYQARRANIRYRPDGGGSPAFVHTLNGSALAWPRTWAALLETYREADGSIGVPECLRPYLRGAASFPPQR